MQSESGRAAGLWWAASVAASVMNKVLLTHLLWRSEELAEYHGTAVLFLSGKCLFDEIKLSYVEIVLW